MESLSLLRLLVGAFFLGYASYSDLKTRRVRNRVWILLGLIGFIFLAVDLYYRSEAIWAHYLIFIPAGLMYYDVYLDRKPILDDDGFRFEPLGFLIMGVVIATLSIQGYLLYDNPDHRALFLQLLTIPVMIIVAHIFFQTGLLKGGADAKALMALAVLVPFYPAFDGFPLVMAASRVSEIMTVLFPFALVILMNSAILVIFVPLVYLLINARRGDFEFPRSLLGLKVGLDGLPKHVWLMERVEDGRVKTVLFPRGGGNTDEQIRALKDLGRKEAWATPQLPFMVPMFFGLIASFIIGNFVLAFIYAIV